MNRADVVRNILIWERVAEAATEKAREYRNQLDADARAEFEEQGTAPTWRLADIATVSLPVSKQRVVVDDERALVGWVQRTRPTEVETRVRKGFLSVLPNVVRVDDGQVFDQEGELVPGLSVRPGGIPGAVTIRAADEAKALISAHARDMLAAIDGAFNEPEVHG